MRAHEIDIRYVNPERITTAALRELENALAREGPGLTPVELGIMYGDELHDIEVEQARLDLEQTKAEIGRLQAQAAQDRAEAALASDTLTCANANTPTRSRIRDGLGGPLG